MRSLLVVLLAAAPVTAAAQTAASPHVLAGRVTTADSVPIVGVRVTLVEAQRTALTDAEGTYRLLSPSAGTFTVTFTRLGIAPLVRRIAINGRTRLDAVVTHTYVELPTVQAVATATTNSVFASPQPTSVLEAATLRTAHGASVGDAVEGLPGLRSLSMSPGIGKPVIRGLTSNRVVVVDDGQRLETQQWGSDHAPNVETIGASRIEVLRGPASVLYGSDALGGVINIVRPPPPDAIDIAAFVRGRLATTMLTNPGGGEATATLETASGGIGARLALTRRSTSDVETPARDLSNTGNAATNLELATGYRGDAGSVALTYVTRRERIEIYEDPIAFPTFSGYQRIKESRAGIRASMSGRPGRVDASATFERNHRSEYGDVRATHVDLGLLSTTLTGQVAYHHAPLRGVAGTVGVSWLDNTFEKFGVETLIPSNAFSNVGAFAFEQLELGRWSLSAGARYDTRSLSADADPVLKLEPQRRSWSAVTGNLGALYRVSEPIAIVVNVGRGFRAPSAADLFANGYHEGTRAYERGDPNLGVESSLNLDVAVRAQTSSLTAEIATFANRIRDYIYLRPAGTLDTLDHVQGDALLRGFEAYAEYAPVRWGSIRATADYTRGDNTTVDVPLPFIPPARATLRLRVSP